MTHEWFGPWLETKRRFARTDEIFMDRDEFFALTVGTGFPAIAQTSTFSYADADEGALRFSGASVDGEAPFARIYTRLGNPTTEVLETLLVDLDARHIAEAARAAGVEGPTVAGQVFSSGLAAIGTTIVSLAHAGDEILVGDVVYGGTVGLLKHFKERFGITTHYVDTTDAAAVARALDEHPQARMLFVETPDNPTLKVTDIREIAALSEKHGVPLVVDNTFATPYLQQPLRLGADIVVQSMTKYISGHSTSVGGVVVGPHGFIRNHLFPFAKDFGACVSPFESWLNRVTVSTLGHRVEHQCANAQKVAEFLVEHPRITSVAYPGLPGHRHHERAKKQMRLPGAMIAFEMEGGVEPAKKLMNYFARHDTPMELAVSLGSVISYIQHPASMTHAGVPKAERLKAGLTDELVRLSVGIEGATVLLRALDEGLRLAYS